MGMGERLQHAWNAFLNKDPTFYYQNRGVSYSYRADRPRLSRGNERSIVTAVYNRIAMDVAAIDIKHVRLDENERFVEEIKSNLNECLSTEANIDQTGRSFIQDTVLSCLDEGVVAMVPVETTDDPNITGAFDINSLRVGQILQWFPTSLQVRVYNEKTGLKEDIYIAKKAVAIIENPLYAVINEPNSTMQRLIRKLNLLDAVDEQSSSGKLDLIIQLPYVIKTEARRQQAENRRKDIEQQLSGSKYGIAYTDGTEHITQLNRSVENNLMKQIEYLTSMLYSQLGITQGVLDGTADEKTMLNYYNRTTEPFLAAIVDEMKRKFLTKTARSQMQSIVYFRDPFKLVPVSDLSEIADKFTRNEIMSPNEIRQIIGMKPSMDSKSDELRNRNLSDPAGTMDVTAEEDLEPESDGMTQEEYDAAIQDLDDLDKQLDELEAELEDDELKHYASPYYDPVKAHEYYMKNRELKARKSTAKLNEDGKNAARYVKEQLSTERKSKVKTHKDSTNSQIENLREQKKANTKAYKEAMQGKIDSLRAKLKSMSKEEKARNKESIQKQIASLREDNKKERIRLSEEFKASSASLRTAHKEERTRLKEEYDEKYVQELEKIRSDSKFQKSSKKNQVQSLNHYLITLRNKEEKFKMDGDNKKFDFSGWVTKNDLQCTDGRTIRHNAFRDQNGKIVPLVWNHLHTSPENVLGNVLLEHRDEGVYGYGTFNDSKNGKLAKIFSRTRRY